MDYTVCLLTDRTTETTLQETCQMTSYWKCIILHWITLVYTKLERSWTFHCEHWRKN
jgi:hypothetical protein